MRLRNRHLEQAAPLQAEPVVGDITKLPAIATPQQIVAKVNELVDQVNRLKRAWLAESVLTFLEES